MPPATEAGQAPDVSRPTRSGPTRRDPAWLLIAAGLLLAARAGLGAYEAAHSPVPRGNALAETDLVRWRPLADGLAEARASGRPILYDFTADWCPPCRMMQRQVFADSQAAAELERRFVPVRVLDRQREEGRNAPWVDSLQARYRVDSFPTLVVTDADGREIQRLRGFMGRGLMLAQLRSGRAGSRPGLTPTPPTGPR